MPRLVVDVSLFEIQRGRARVGGGFYPKEYQFPAQTDERVKG